MLFFLYRGAHSFHYSFSNPWDPSLSKISFHYSHSALSLSFSFKCWCFSPLALPYLLMPSWSLNLLNWWCHTEIRQKFSKCNLNFQILSFKFNLKNSKMISHLFKTCPIFKTHLQSVLKAGCANSCKGMCSCLYNGADHFALVSSHFTQWYSTGPRVFSPFQFEWIITEGSLE